MKRCIKFVMVMTVSLLAVACSSDDDYSVAFNEKEHPEWLKEWIDREIQTWSPALDNGWDNGGNLARDLPKVYSCEWKGSPVYFLFSLTTNYFDRVRSQDGTRIEFDWANNEYNEFCKTCHTWKCIWRMSKTDNSLPRGFEAY